MFNSSHSKPQHWMEMVRLTSQLLYSLEMSPWYWLNTRLGGSWEQLWTFWRTEKSPTPARNWTHIIQLTAQSLYWM